MELDLLVSLHDNQEGEGEESEVLAGVGVALQVEDVVREDPVLLVLLRDVPPTQQDAGQRAGAQDGRRAQILCHL